MARKLTASDRKNLIRLASTMPKGSDERRAILAGLKKTGATLSDRDFWEIVDAVGVGGSRDKKKRLREWLLAWGQKNGKSVDSIGQLSKQFDDKIKNLTSKMRRSWEASGAFAYTEVRPEDRPENGYNVAHDGSQIMELCRFAVMSGKRAFDAAMSNPREVMPRIPSSRVGRKPTPGKFQNFKKEYKRAYDPYNDSFWEILGVGPRDIEKGRGGFKGWS